MDNNHTSAACCLADSALLAKGVLEIRSGKLPFGSINEPVLNEPVFAPFFAAEKKARKRQFAYCGRAREFFFNALLYDA
jgi:hypothetical protein